MPSFKYKAMRGDGSFAEGTLEAGGRGEACLTLEGRGLSPVRVEETGNGNGNGAAAANGNGHGGGAGLSNPFARRRVPVVAVENFTRQLASLLAAGVPLSRALQVLEREAKEPRARRQWKEIRERVVDGVSLAESMGRSPETFPRVYTAMIEAGEAGGFLDAVLVQIADFQGRQRELLGRVKSAMIYPVVLLVLVVVVLIFLMTFFIPRFTKIYEGFGAELPWLTELIIQASVWTTSYGLYMLAALGIGYWVGRRWLAGEEGQRAWQRALLSLPVIGPLVARFAMTRFCRMLGTLVGAGVPLISALRVASESIGNRTLTDAVRQSIDRVKQGEGLAASLADCRALFPGSVLEMIAVAEETGRLDAELVRIAQATEGELDSRLRNAVALTEPLILFVMAALIGVIFIGMVLPIFNIQDYIK